MTQPASISFIANTSEIGGAERYLTTLAAGIHDRGMRVWVPSQSLADDLAERLGSIEVGLLPTDGFSIRPGALVKAWSFYRGLPPGIVHFNLANPCASTVDIMAARLGTGSAIVLTTHLPDVARTRRERISDRLALRLAHRIITVCESARKYLIARGVPEQKVSTVYNGVSDWQISPKAIDRLRSELALRPGQLVLGTVARMEEQKGLRYLLQAFGHLGRDDVVLCLVGDGSQTSELKRLAGDLGIAGRTRFCGWRTDSRDLISLFDVFVLPSMFESFPFTVVEAMMAGRPVVASDVGGVSEAVLHEKTGLMVKPGDVDELGAAVRTLLESPELRMRMGQQARSIALAKFSDDIMVRKTLELYDQLADRSPTRVSAEKVGIGR